MKSIWRFLYCLGFITNSIVTVNEINKGNYYCLISLFFASLCLFRLFNTLDNKNE